jgi:dolichyl-diphosphooligosaccharide--protein glycosyltransferase/undecaprenyl-diphosphooligosaccharide--protein glycosyltransferase
MQTSSPELAANLSRLAVETYVDSNYSIVSNTIFKNGKKDQLDPNDLLAELENSTYKLPKKTRDIYIYFPYRMMNIFPTVQVFGNLDLTTGKEERRSAFYATYAIKDENSLLTFANGIKFDANKGYVEIGNQKVGVKYFMSTQILKNGKTKLQSQLYSTDGKFVVIYMKSYNKFLITDVETFKSTFVQMFVLGRYNKNLFELVVSSPYSKIYKLKR